MTVKVSKETLSALHLDVGMTEIASCVRAQVRRIRNDVHANEAEYTLTVAPAMTSTETLFFDMRTLRETLQTTVISGIPLVDRAVITVREEAGICDNKLSGYQLLVEGNALRQVMGTPGVVGTRTSSNHIMEVESVLGIEAVRRTIIHEIQYTMGKHGMSIDSRHVQLLADVMTYRGEVLGITRFGMAKMKDSVRVRVCVCARAWACRRAADVYVRASAQVMLLASFEKTTDHLFEAAAHTRRDSIDGVSERIIMGESVPLGTGLFSLLDGCVFRAAVRVVCALTALHLLAQDAERCGHRASSGRGCGCGWGCGRAGCGVVGRSGGGGRARRGAAGAGGRRRRAADLQAAQADDRHEEVPRGRDAFQARRRPLARARVRACLRALAVLESVAVRRGWQTVGTAMRRGHVLPSHDGDNSACASGRVLTHGRPTAPGSAASHDTTDTRRHGGACPHVPRHKAPHTHTLATQPTRHPARAHAKA